MFKTRKKKEGKVKEKIRGMGNWVKEKERERG